MLPLMATKSKNLLGSIYHNKARKNYRFRYGRDGTVRVFKLKRDAEAYQVEFTKKLKADGTSAVDTMKASREAQQAFETLAKHKLPASALVDAVNLYVAQTNPSSRHLTFSEALSAVRKTDRFNDLAKGTRADYNSRWTRLEVFLEGKKLAEITPSLLETFLKKKCAASTRFKFYAAINVLWETYFIGTKRVTKFNPLKELPDPPQKPSSKRKEPYTCSEVFQLLDAVEHPQIDRNDVADIVKAVDVFPKLAVALNIAFYTGMRTSELCRLQLKDFMRGSVIDWENNPKITLADSKTKEKREKGILVPPCLVKYLKGNSYFNSLSAEDRIYPHTPRTLKEAMKERALVSGVTWKGAATTRTTFGTHAVDGLFNSISQTARQLGHSTNETSLKHYVKYASTEDCKRYFQRGL